MSLTETQFSLMWRIFVLLAFVPRIVAITNARILLARRNVLGSRLFNLATIIELARRAENAPHTNFYFLRKERQSRSNNINRPQTER